MNGAPLSSPTGASAAPLETDLFGLILHVLSEWKLVLGATGAGLFVGLGVLFFAPARFDGSALVLIRTESDALNAAVTGALPVQGLPTSFLGGGLKDELETELAILQSRAVAAVVVDSLRLQLRAVSPSRIAPLSFVDSMRLPGRFQKFTASLVPGRNELPPGVVYVRATAPRSLRVKVSDREDAIDEFTDRLNVRKAGGEVVRVTYQARDSVTAAAAPNLLVATYLVRRKTVDRGLNQRRFEFMANASDSIAREMRAAADVRRAIQDANNLPALEPTARALIEQAVDLETKLTVQRAEEVAFDSALSAGGDVRRLAAIPAFLRSPAVNDLVAELAKLETERQSLLATAPPTAPAVRAVELAKDSLRAQLAPMASTYRTSLVEQRRVLQNDLAATRQRIKQLPAAGEALFLAESRLGRLSVLDNGMGQQVLQARLAALSEGGDVRVIDPAVSPRKVAFPRPALTLAAATALGLLLGLGLALIRTPRVAAAS